ncbi:MAG: RagB/SusD family nutrient uptake outer membrane protein [Tannerella sp.]|jgi:hypothetical protein|nr:RagB/SusD family nutrient uptake outer membrane protein [Tannerella sp.]
MKIKNIIKCFLALSMTGVVSCVDLDITPQSTVSPELFFDNASQLQSYAARHYRHTTTATNPAEEDVFPVHGTYSYGSFGIDIGTDNQANKDSEERWRPGDWKVPQSGTDWRNWNFIRIYRLNFFFEQAQPKLDAGLITGSINDINNSFGEMYFFRAFEYFEKIKKYGDFPIITKTLPNDMAILTEASVRQPVNEVARFIIEDLDKAIEFLNSTQTYRLNKNAALLFKSRVALYMGTWLKYFAGTPFVPNGPGWPGASKNNAGYQFPAGSLEAESKWFLAQAIDAAKKVADVIPLEENNGVVRMKASDPNNRYFTMFGDVNLDGYKEVIFYRQLTATLGAKHQVPNSVRAGTYRGGLTRGYVDNFLMANGLPIYANGSGYWGDDYISDVRKDRDGRLSLFLKEPGQPNMLDNVELGVWQQGISGTIEQYPSITTTDAERNYSTGYTLRKGGSYDGYQAQSNNGCYTSSIVFRGVEAYLNYMEAYYELNGSLDATAQGYWTKIRERAKVDVDYNKTINATDMNIEATNDWGAYSAGAILTDKTLYNIRRERRCELMAEGLRLIDLRRWRALDQMKTTAYHIEGFKLWGPMKDVEDAPWNKSFNGEGPFPLVYYPSNNANVSPPSSSIYIRPNEFNPSNQMFLNGVPVGYKWAMAHYLTPIDVVHFQITSPDSKTVEQSTIYQNPYWPIVADAGAIE